MLTRFDAYTATTRAAGHPELINLCLQTGDKTRHGRGQHGFGERVSFVDVSGSEGGSVSWGGSHGSLVMVEVKGERTPLTVERLRAAYEHHCTRVDSCYDVDELGAFEALLEPCMQVKRGFKLKGSKAGDWEDFPECGRTLYIGADSSPVKARLYEKGLHPAQRLSNRPNWVRLELQVRPAKLAKSAYSRVDALGVWGASSWTRELAALVLQSAITPLPAGSVHKESEQTQALHHMCRQYAGHLMGLRNDLGSWEEVGYALAEIIRKEKLIRRKS